MLFWNTHKNENINPIICEIVAENNISMMVLAEYNAKMEDLLNTLFNEYGLSFQQYFSACERIKIGGIKCNIEPRFENGHMTIQIINGKDILCCVHLNSKIYSNHVAYREILIEEIIKEIQKVESDLNTENTIVVGDFNLNPYESSFVDARYLHGVPIYEEAKRKVREIAGRDYSMFYNPMWRFLGDEKQPYGTYYHNTNDVMNTYWNIYDQVIIRPALKERFIDESLKIITETQSRYLLDSNGHPDHNISDHLPIIFEIKEEYNNGKET